MGTRNKGGSSFKKSLPEFGGHRKETLEEIPAYRVTVLGTAQDLPLSFDISPPPPWDDPQIEEFYRELRRGFPSFRSGRSRIYARYGITDFMPIFDYITLFAAVRLLESHYSRLIYIVHTETPEEIEEPEERVVIPQSYSRIPHRESPFSIQGREILYPGPSKDPHPKSSIPFYMEKGLGSYTSGNAHQASSSLYEVEEVSGSGLSKESKGSSRYKLEEVLSPSKDSSRAGPAPKTESSTGPKEESLVEYKVSQTQDDPGSRIVVPTPRYGWEDKGSSSSPYLSPPEHLQMILDYCPAPELGKRPLRAEHVPVVRRTLSAGSEWRAISPQPSDSSLSSEESEGSNISQENESSNSSQENEGSNISQV